MLGLYSLLYVISSRGNATPVTLEMLDIKLDEPEPVEVAAGAPKIRNDSSCSTTSKLAPLQNEIVGTIEIFAARILSSVTEGVAEGWRPLPRKHDVDAWVKQELPYQASKASGVIEAPPWVMYDLFTDMSRRPQWDVLWDTGSCFEEFPVDALQAVSPTLVGLRMLHVKVRWLGL